jgi:hypothetical protein
MRNADQVQRMAQILQLEKDMKNFKKRQLFCRAFRIYYFGALVLKDYNANKK